MGRTSTTPSGLHLIYNPKDSFEKDILERWKNDLIINDEVESLNSIKLFPVDISDLSVLNGLSDCLKRRFKGCLCSFAFGHYDNSALIGILILEYIINRILNDRNIKIRKPEVPEYCNNKNSCNIYRSYLPGLKRKIDLVKESGFEIDDRIVDILKKTQNVKHPDGIQFSSSDAREVIHFAFKLLKIYKIN